MASSNEAPTVTGLPPNDPYCNIPEWVLRIAEREQKLYQIEHHPVALARGLVMEAIQAAVKNSSSLRGLQNPETGESIVQHYTCAQLATGCVEVAVQQGDRLPEPWTTPSLCFDNLRMDASHPARSPSDTYYRRSEPDGELRLLRTHTSAHQMELLQGMGQLLGKGIMDGCALTLTGDVYRKDEIDASHHVVHHQMEGLRLRRVKIDPEGDCSSDARRRAVEAAKLEADRELRALLEGVMAHVYCGLMDKDSQQGEKMGNRQGMEDLLRQAQSDLVSGMASNSAVEKRLQKAADEAGLQVLYRPHLIPYVSPGYEMDIKMKEDPDSDNCSKWVEVLGCGLIHDDVLINAGLDPQEYVGWAYGMGLERIVMQLLGIPDIRRMWELDNPDLLHQGRRLGQIIEEATRGSSWVAAWTSGLLSKDKLRWDDLPYSKYPPADRAMTIRLPDLSADNNHSIENPLTCWNDVYELINTVAKVSGHNSHSDLHIESVTEAVQDWDKNYSERWSAAKKERYLARKALSECGLLKTLDIRCRSATRNLTGEEVAAVLLQVHQEVERRGGKVE